MAEFNLESIIKSSVEKALNTPVYGGKTISEWAAIGMKNGGGWISVEEESPDDYGWYAIYGRNLYGNPFVTIGWLSGTGEWVGKYGRLDQCEITHWVPLPERLNAEAEAM